jgi:hypothetical protein
MNRIRSFEKQIDSVSSYQYYYSPQNSPSSTDSSSFYSHSSRRKHSRTPTTPPPPQQITPLTLENVSKVELADPSSMPLARYCSEMEAAPFHPAYSESTISVTRKSQHRRAQQQQEDTVLESPRILPFPYHNDSYFLPTAEHDYPGGCSTTDASSSMISLSIHTMGSRQQLTSPPSSYHPNRGYQRQLFSKTTQHEYHPRRYDDDETMSNLSHKRRAASVTPSSPSTLRDEAIMVPQKKRRSNNKFASRFKQNLLRFKSSNSTILEMPQSSSSSSSRSPSVHTFGTPKEKTLHPSSWYEKLWKFLRPQPFVKKSKSTISAPVWYSQFRCNPPPPAGINLLS